MFFRKIRVLALPAVLLVLLFISLILFAHTLIQRQSVQAFLVGRISDAIGVDIRTQKIDLNLFGGIGLSIQGFEAKSRKEGEYIAAERVRVLLDTGDLIRGRITPTSLRLIRPEIELFLGDDFGPPTGREDAGIGSMWILWILKFRSIAVDDGHVTFKARDFSMDALSFQGRQTGSEHPAMDLRGRGEMRYHGQTVAFQAHGTVLPPSGREASTTLDLMFETAKVPLTWIPWPESMPFRQGEFETQLRIGGDPKGVTCVGGRIVIGPFQFALLHDDRVQEYAIPGLTLDFQSDIKDRMLHLGSVQMKNRDLSFDIEGKLDPETGNNPYIELSVRSGEMPVRVFKTIFPSPLLPSWVQERLFPMLNAGDIRLKRLKMEGTIDRLRHLKKEENRQALEMDFECRDLEVQGGGIPFEEVSALISLKEGDFRISGLKGNFGHSEIRNAELDIYGIFDKPASYEGIFHGSFDIRELLEQKEMQFIPIGMRERLQPLQEASGKMECGLRFGYTGDGKYPRILEGQFLFHNCTFIHKALLLPLRLRDAVIGFKENGPNRFTGTGRWGDSTFRTEGDFDLERNDLQLNHVNVSADPDIGQVFPTLFDMDLSSVTVKESATTNLSMTVRDGRFVVQGDMDLNHVILETGDILIDPPGRDDRVLFDLEFHPRDTIRMNKVLIHMNGSSMELSGLYDLHKRYFSEMQFYTRGFSMEDLGLYFKKKGIQAKGHVKGEIGLFSPSGKPADTDVLGRIEGKGLRLPELFSPGIRGYELDLDLSGKVVTINHCKMRLGENLLDVSGKLRGWEGLRGDILVQSDFFDMSDIFAPQNGSIGKEEGNGFVANLLNRGQIGVRVEINNGAWRHVKYGPLEAELSFRDGDIYIERSRADLENGFLTLNGRVMGGDNHELLFSGHIKLMDQPVHEIVESIEAMDREIKGSLTMDARFTMGGNEKGDLVPSLTGSGNILIREGLVKRSGVIIKILDFLSLQNVLKTRPPELREEGFYFESMSGDLSMDKGMLRSENFQVRSPVFNAVAYGRIDIPNREADFIMGTQPHGTIDYLVRNIPLLGYIITGEKGSILAYPFRVQGDLSDPEVTFIPFEKLGEGVLGVFKRLFLTPIRVIEELDKGRKRILQED